MSDEELGRSYCQANGVLPSVLTPDRTPSHWDRYAAWAFERPKETPGPYTEAEAYAAVGAAVRKVWKFAKAEGEK